MWFHKSFGVFIAWSCLIMREPKFGLVTAQQLEIDAGNASHYFADVLLVIDTSWSTEDYLHRMIDSLKSLVSRFKIGENNLKFAVIQCHGRVSFYEEEKLILLNFLDGNSKSAVDGALDRLTTEEGNPFIVCFRAALHHVFQEKNGDRPEAPNVVIFPSDAKWGVVNAKTSGNPGEIIETMKRNNVTFIAATYCGKLEEETQAQFEENCKLSQLRNAKVASKPQYSVSMIDFNADNEGIRSALRQSTSCKQKAELLPCEWDATQRCQREFRLADTFSNKVCQQHSRKENLLTKESIAKDAGCIDVQKLNANDKRCVFDKMKTCRAKTFTIVRRAGNHFDAYRNGNPIEEDFNKCFGTQPEGGNCSNELVCLINDCSEDKKLCGNLAYLENCPTAAKKVCLGSDKIDERCLVLYYNRKNDNYIAKVITSWKANEPNIRVINGSMKELCEDGKLRLQCSKWLLDNNFQTTIDAICKRNALVTTVDYNNHFKTSIVDKHSRMTTIAGATRRNAASDLDKSNPKKATGNFSTGLLMAILFLFLVLLALLVFLIVIWIRKRRSRKEKINVAIQPRPPKFKSVSLDADITHGSQSRTLKTHSMTPKKPRGSKNPRPSRNETAKLNTNKKFRKHK